MVPAEVFLTFILMLSIFLGFELIHKVPSTLHTPLMSGSNAISGITLPALSAWPAPVSRIWPIGWPRGLWPWPPSMWWAVTW